MESVNRDCPPAPPGGRSEGARFLRPSRREGHGERLPNIERTQVVGWLEELADACGDVDEYIAIVESEGLVQTYALSVSRRLFEAGRLQEALPPWGMYKDDTL